MLQDGVMFVYSTAISVSVVLTVPGTETRKSLQTMMISVVKTDGQKMSLEVGDSGRELTMVASSERPTVLLREISAPAY